MGSNRGTVAPMGSRHDSNALLEAAVQVAHRDGLSALTFGSVARELGIADRTVVYYFPTKKALVSAVLTDMSERLAELLESVELGRGSLVDCLWPVLTDPRTDPSIRLFVETAGLAAAGQEPFASAAKALTTFWIDWVAAKLKGSKTSRQGNAEAIVATLDGLLLLRILAGPEAAERARRSVRRGTRP